ncbi:MULTISPECIES: carbohydrate ABC transporter permease [unclassified Microbacterium]|uniref:carbohydrate ABC transporter permease n=1 Tax=Microbacterium TaxID=33882 RepID=UPI003B9F5A3F
MTTLASLPARTPSHGRAVPYLFLMLPMLFLGVVVFYPLAREIWISFTDAGIANPNGGDFIGLGNYEEVLASPQLRQALGVTALYTVATVVASLIIGVVSALAVDRPFPGRSIARAVLLFGWAVPNVAAALIWSWMYNQQSGVLNALVTALGGSPIGWLTDSSVAIWSVTLTTVWQVAPFVMLTTLAALQGVPPELREAARIDGADALNVFRTATLPHIRPAIALSALLATVWTIRRFEIIYLLTGGGPLGSTSTLVIQLRREAFENYDLGAAATFGVVGLAVSLAVTVLYSLIEGRRKGGAAS